MIIGWLIVLAVFLRPTALFGGRTALFFQISISACPSNRPWGITSKGVVGKHLYIILLYTIACHVALYILPWLLANAAAIHSDHLLAPNMTKST